MFWIDIVLDAEFLGAPHEEEEEDQDKAAHDTETSSLIWLWIRNYPLVI